MRALLLIPMLACLFFTSSYLQSQSTFDNYMSDPDEQTSGTYYIYVGRFANTELWSINKLNDLEKINSKMIADSSDVINGPYKTQTEAEAAWISMKITGFTKARVYHGAFDITPIQGKAQTEIAATEVEAPIFVESVPVQKQSTNAGQHNTLPSSPPVPDNKELANADPSNTLTSPQFVAPPVYPKPSEKKSGTPVVYSPPPHYEQGLQYENPELDKLLADASTNNDIPIARGISENETDITPIVVPEPTCETKPLYFVQLSAMPDINGEPHAHLADRYNIYVFEDETDHLFKILIGPFEEKGEANQAIKDLKKTPKYAKVFLRKMCYDIGQLNSPLLNNDKAFMQLTVLYSQK